MIEAKRHPDGYDAETDAVRFAAPLKTWANIGFLRGFSGMRTAIIPEGEVSLPSAVFNEIALSHLHDGHVSEDEIAVRKKYIDQVTELLATKQAEYIDEHYRRFIQGHAVDFVSAAVFVALMFGLIYQYGPYHPIPLTLIGLLGIKMLFLFFSVRRMAGIAQQTFTREAHSIRLPWQTP